GQLRGVEGGPGRLPGELLAGLEGPPDEPRHARPHHRDPAPHRSGLHRKDGDGAGCGRDAPPRLRDAAPHPIDLAGAGLAAELGGDGGDPGETVGPEEVPAAEAATGWVHRGLTPTEPEGVEVLELFVAEG